MNNQHRLYHAAFFHHSSSILDVFWFCKDLNGCMKWEKRTLQGKSPVTVKHTNSEWNKHLSSCDKIVLRSLGINVCDNSDTDRSVFRTWYNPLREKCQRTLSPSFSLERLKHKLWQYPFIQTNQYMKVKTAAKRPQCNRKWQEI